jgi:hypothetical protein
MSFWLRLCLGLFFLAPSLAHAQSSLDIPSDGDKLSGIGLVSGWKCEAEGEITIVFNDGDPEEDAIPTTYGAPRGDTSAACGDDDGNNGFYALWNWAILGDGEHTAVAYDNGVEFARKTFTVTTTGEEFLTGASKCITVDDFPSDGETTYLEWNESTQHFEMVESCGTTPSEPVDLGMCMVGLTVQPGQMCSGSIPISAYTFTVNAEGEACIDDTSFPSIHGCYSTMLPELVVGLGVDVTRNDDGSWTINALP